MIRVRFNVHAGVITAQCAVAPTHKAVVLAVDGDMHPSAGMVDVACLDCDEMARRGKDDADRAALGARRARVYPSPGIDRMLAAIEGEPHIAAGNALRNAALDKALESIAEGTKRVGAWASRMAVIFGPGTVVDQQVKAGLHRYTYRDQFGIARGEFHFTWKTEGETDGE